MSANSLDEMLCEWEKLAERADDYNTLAWEWPKEEMIALPPFWIQRVYLARLNPKEIISLISLVRAALAPHLPVELPERPRPESISSAGAEMFEHGRATKHMDALEAEIARLREERDLLEWADRAKGKQLLEYHEALATAKEATRAEDLESAAKFMCGMCADGGKPERTSNGFHHGGNLNLECRASQLRSRFERDAAVKAEGK